LVRGFVYIDIDALGARSWEYWELGAGSGERGVASREWSIIYD
jgi:hypothetical protein